MQANVKVLRIGTYNPNVQMKRYRQRLVKMHHLRNYLLHNKQRVCPCVCVCVRLQLFHFKNQGAGYDEKCTDSFNIRFVDLKCISVFNQCFGEFQLTQPMDPYNIIKVHDVQFFEISPHQYNWNRISYNIKLTLTNSVNI